MPEPDTPSFEALLGSTLRSAIHLEMRDEYMPSDPAFITWRQGGAATAPEEDPEYQDWLSWVREATGRGVAIRRARVCGVPESDSIRFEHHLTPHNIAAGEEVRWLPRRKASDIALPGNDFWVFDDRLVLFLHFDGWGEPAADWMELSTSPDSLKLCTGAFETVWARAVPHSEHKLA